MFTHLVILKKSPWFIYCQNEKDALKTCDSFQGEVSGIVVGKDLIVKQPRYVQTLEQAETLQIEHVEGEPEPDEGSLEEQLAAIDIAKEITNEFTKELES